SAATQAQHRFRVTCAGSDAGGKHRLDGGQLPGVQAYLKRPEVLLEIAHPAGAGNGHDVLPLRQHPGERQLRRAAALRFRERSHLIDQRQIAREVLALEARVGAPVVIGLEILGALDGAGEKAAAERTVGHEADAEALAALQYAVLGIARPQRVLALQRRDAVHAVGAHRPSSSWVYGP